MAKTKQQPRRHALIPSVGELVGYPIVACLLLLVLTFSRTMKHYDIQLEGYDFLEGLASLRANLTDNILPNLATALVWALIGLTVYLAVWLLVDSAGKAVQATSLAQRFVYPSKTSRQVFAITVFGQLGVRVVAVLGLVVWLLSLVALVGWAADYFYRLTIFASVSDAIHGLGATILLGVYLFLGALVARLIFLRPRVLSD